MASMGTAPVGSALASFMVSQARSRDSSSWEGQSHTCSNSIYEERYGMIELEAIVSRDHYGGGLPNIQDKQREKGGVMPKRGGRSREEGGAEVWLVFFSGLLASWLP